MSNHLFSLITKAMPAADKVFMDVPGGETITYGQMEARAAQYANALVALGVKPGDRVAVQVEKSPSAIFLYLGCVRAGAIFLPLNSAYTSAELDYFIGDAEPSLIVCDPKKAADIAAIAGGRALETLDKDGKGSLHDKASLAASTFQDVAVARMISPPFSTHPAPQAAPRARCSVMTISPPMP